MYSLPYHNSQRARSNPPRALPKSYDNPMNIHPFVSLLNCFLFRIFIRYCVGMLNLQDNIDAQSLGILSSSWEARLRTVCSALYAAGFLRGRVCGEIAGRPRGLG